MKNVYLFGTGITEGSANQQNILGGKGANLAEMSNLKIPVPPGFTLPTHICNQFLKENKWKWAPSENLSGTCIYNWIRLLTSTT